MMKKKGFLFVLIAILGFPQIAFAQSLIKASTFINNNESVEITEDNLLLTQRKRSSRRKRARRSRRKVHRPSRPGRKARRRARRRGFRDGARRARVGAAVTGIIGVGIGAAIADSAREDEAITETIIINEGDTLDNRDYYDDYYDTDFDQGGYYDGGGFDDGF